MTIGEVADGWFTTTTFCRKGKYVYTVIVIQADFMLCES